MDIEAVCFRYETYNELSDDDIRWLITEIERLSKEIVAIQENKILLPDKIEAVAKSVAKHCAEANEPS
jgi:hypothetical protein